MNRPFTVPDLLPMHGTPILASQANAFRLKWLRRFLADARRRGHLDHPRKRDSVLAIVELFSAQTNSRWWTENVFADDVPVDVVLQHLYRSL